MAPSPQSFLLGRKAAEFRLEPRFDLDEPFFNGPSTLVTIISIRPVG